MSFYSDPSLDAELDKLATMRTAQEYEAQSRVVYRKIHDDAALIPLWSYDAIYAIRDGVTYQPFKNVTWPVLWFAEKKVA